MLKRITTFIDFSWDAMWWSKNCWPSYHYMTWMNYLYLIKVNLNRTLWPHPHILCIWLLLNLKFSNRFHLNNSAFTFQRGRQFQNSNKNKKCTNEFVQGLSVSINYMFLLNSLVALWSLLYFNEIAPVMSIKEIKFKILERLRDIKTLQENSWIYFASIILDHFIRGLLLH